MVGMFSNPSATWNSNSQLYWPYQTSPHKWESILPFFHLDPFGATKQGNKSFWASIPCSSNPPNKNKVTLGYFERIHYFHFGKAPSICRSWQIAQPLRSLAPFAPKTGGLCFCLKGNGRSSAWHDSMIYPPWKWFVDVFPWPVSPSNLSFRETEIQSLPQPSSFQIRCYALSC